MEALTAPTSVPASRSNWLGLDALRSSALAVLVALTAFGFGTSTTAHALEKVKAVIPQNSVFVLSWEGARDAGIFKKRGRSPAISRAFRRRRPMHRPIPASTRS
jgi:hypothetical protein